MFNINDFKKMQVGLASPEKIREWSYGEVTKCETIDYKTLKPEKDGFFCEKIFGPVKDYECSCGKYKKYKFHGQKCEKCGVEITTKSVRRERMGHIELACPIAHIWYVKNAPSSRMAVTLNVKPKELEQVVYFVSYIVLNPGKDNSYGLLQYKQILSETNARIVFKDIIERIGQDCTDDADRAKAQALYNELADHKSSFDFDQYSRFIGKYTGAEFGWGSEAIQRLLREINLQEEFEKCKKELEEVSSSSKSSIIKRMKVLDAFIKSGNKPEWMVLTVLPVEPPDLRPLLPLDGGRFACSDINELYLLVLYRNNQLKSFLEKKAPDQIIMNAKRSLQAAVDALIDNEKKEKPEKDKSGKRAYKSLSSNLKGKEGRFRQNLLGKRVDYSGRSVIAVGPTLKMYQCGIPRDMALQLFEPFIIAKLREKGIVQTTRQANARIAEKDPKIWPILDEIIKDHPVLLNRAPTLHRLGIQAYEPVLVDGKVIRLYPLATTAFNADFDGDQMAVHVPLRKESIEEARTRMLGSLNILGPKDGEPIVTPSQDMILGNYYLTMEETRQDFERKASKAETEYDKERFTKYAKAEGTFYHSIEAAIAAYETKEIHIHNRIILRMSSLVDNYYFTEDDRKFEYIITTPGQLIFNKIFKETHDFDYIVDMDAAKNGKSYLFNMKEVLAELPKDASKEEVVAHIMERVTKNDRAFHTPVGKKHLKKIIAKSYANNVAFYGEEEGTKKTSSMLDAMKDQGFKFSTISAATISIGDIFVVDGKKEIIDEYNALEKKIVEDFAEGILSEREKEKKLIESWKEASDKIEKATIKQINTSYDNPLNFILGSGARGNNSQMMQLSGMRGLMSSTTGKTMETPVKSSFREGNTVSEFFISTHGARKGGADTALKTASSGYLTRRLVDVAQDIVITEENCANPKGTWVEAIIDENIEVKPGEKDDAKVIKSLEERLVGRYSFDDVVNPTTGEVIVKADTLMTKEDAKRIDKAGIKRVKIRSILGCSCKDGVCAHCYGLNLARGTQVKVGEAVGIIAAQSIGEPGTQLTMRNKNTGGVAGLADITQGLPRVNELLEVSEPKGKALISDIEGTVEEIRNENDRLVFVISNGIETRKLISNYKASKALYLDSSYRKVREDPENRENERIQVGDKIRLGQQLTEGSIDLKSLLTVVENPDGSRKADLVQEYILREVSKVYKTSAEVSINDKHIEIIIKLMFRKVLITDSGDTTLITGATEDIADVTAANKVVLLEGKTPAKFVPTILGIKKSALSVQSFLSAASFQETTKVLTDAAIYGKVDYLHGLKENVIVGKKIPAGTGLFDDEEEIEQEEVKEELHLNNYQLKA